MFERPEFLIGDKLPFEDHIDDLTVVHKDAAVTRGFEFYGVYPDTADDADAAGWYDRLHGFFMNIAADDIEITILRHRGDAEASFCQDGPHTTEFARSFSAAYRETLLRNTLYWNRLFFLVTVHPPAPVKRSMLKFIADSMEDPRVGIVERRERLARTCDWLMVQLAEFGPRPLGLEERGGHLYSQIFEAVVLAMTGKWRPVPLTTGPSCHGMFSETLKFRRGRIEFQGAGDPHYAEMYAFKQYPMNTWPGMFHQLSMATYRLTVAQSFRFLSNAAAQSVVDRKQNTATVAGDKAISQIAALGVAADELISRKWVLGDHSMVVIAFGDDERQMHNVGNATWRDLAACGVVATRITAGVQAAWLSLFPGNRFWRLRPGYVKSGNFVAFEPLYNLPQGAETSKWGGPIVTLRTPAGTPFRFHWHPPNNITGGNANTLLTGMGGAGKTTLIAALFTQTSGRARIVALDHKRGWQFLIKALDGDYAVWGAGQPHCSPLKALSDAPCDIEFLTELFRGCIGEMTEEEGKRLAIGLQTLMTLPPELRDVGELRAFFDTATEGAGVRLDKWCHGNELGWVLDAPVDTVQFGSLSGIDTTAIMDNPRARGPLMAYLFYRVLALLDGQPVLIPVDEGWRALMDQDFRDAIEKHLRTIRSKNGVSCVHHSVARRHCRGWHCACAY